jgi:glycosyltransferase involved in cell wall biosynthesis
LRVRSPATKDIGYLRRVINEFRLPYALLRGLRQSGLHEQRWDGVVWYSPTIFLAPIVRQLRRKSGCRSYLILRDIFPEWAVNMGLMKRGPAYLFFKAIENSQYGVADVIGVQSPGNLDYLKHWAMQRGRRVEVLNNWLSERPNLGCRINLAESHLAGKKIFGYIGNMGVAQGLDVFIELASKLRERVGFVFVGRGSDAERLRREARGRGLSHVVFHDEIDPGEIPGFLSQCHVGIVSLDPRHKTHNIPGKFIAYMHGGVPVLANVNSGNDLVELIGAERVGQACISCDVLRLQSLAEGLLSDSKEHAAMSRRAKMLAHRSFSAERAATQIVAALARDDNAPPQDLTSTSQ